MCITETTQISSLKGHALYLDLGHERYEGICYCLSSQHIHSEKVQKPRHARGGECISRVPVPAAVSEGLLSAQVGGIAPDLRSQPRYGGAANGDDSAGYVEVGDRVRAPYSRGVGYASDGRVFGRLGGSGVIQMDTDEMDVRRMRRF